MFSEMMIPRSATSPMAIAIPASDMMLASMRKPLHADERHQHCHWQRHRDDDACPHVEQKDDNDDRGDYQFLTQRFGERGHRLIDEPGPVVNRHDLHAVQTGLDLFDLFADTLDHRPRILAESHHDDAADCLACR